MVEQVAGQIEGVRLQVRDLLEANPGFRNRAELACITCDGRFPTTPQPIYNCPDAKCRDILDVVYDFGSGFDPEELKQLWSLRRTSQKPEDRSGVWRFRELLPFIDDPSKVVTLGEGNTPLLEAPRCAEYTGLRRLLVKHQGFNPTGSFKDPGMSAATTQAKILEMRAVACASTGNTSASAAAYARRADMLPVVLLPEGQVSYGKLSQALEYDALVLQIGGDFDKAMELVMTVAPELGILVVNSIYPFRIEGQKTIVPELLEQLNWQVPDRIVVPGGNLSHASSIWKGLRDLRTLGMIDRYPKITVVQAQGADPLYRTITSGDQSHLITVHAKTLATAVKIGNPVSWKKAIDGIEGTGGWVTEVSEQQIADAKAIIGRDGIGCEPASALTVAGLKRIVEEGTDTSFDKDETVVAVLTGHMLKDPDYPVRYHAGELYEEYVTESRIIQRGPKVRSNFANRLIYVEPDPKELKRIILSRLH